MKVSKKQIRRIIREELNRELPISYYSDDVLMQEGLLDWLGDLFGKLVGFFSGEADQGASEFGSVAKESFGESNLQKIAKKHGLEGIGPPGSFDYSDLDFSEEKHRLVFFESWANMSAAMEEDVALLEKAAAMKDWTPKDDSDEAVKEWQEKNGEAAGGFWGVVGSVRWMCGWLGTDFELKGGTKISGELETAEDSGNPGEAAQGLIAGLEWLVTIFDKGVKDGSEYAQKLVDVTKKLGSGATKVGEAIAASGEEQQKESLELRKLINTLTQQVIRG